MVHRCGIRMLGVGSASERSHGNIGGTLHRAARLSFIPDKDETAGSTVPGSDKVTAVPCRTGSRPPSHWNPAFTYRTLARYLR
jgi:hypothetical protein